MMYQTFSSNPFRRGISSPVIMFFIGLLMVVIPYDVMKGILHVFIGLGIVLVYSVPCILYWMTYDKEKKGLLPAILSTVTVAAGIIFLILHNWITCVILGAWLIVLSIIHVFQAENKLERVRKEIPYLAIATLLFFFPAESILRIVLIVFGSILMAISVIQIIVIAILNKKLENAEYDNDDESDDEDNNHHTPSGGARTRVVIDAEVKELK